MELKKLDKVFSEYIRRCDADENGYVKCCTCQTVKHWKEMDCGHYYGRSNLSVRWDEMNANAQCVDCNRFKYGSAIHYIFFMKTKYSSTQLDELDNKASDIVKFMQHEIDELVEIYKQKINNL